MNTKKKAIEQIEDFIKSDEKSVIINGTHQYNKHKLVAAILNRDYPKSKILFRTAKLSNLPGEDFAGFLGLRKQPKGDTWTKLADNYYKFDTFTRRNNASTFEYYDFAIVYPIDAIFRGAFHKDVINELYDRYDIGKIFIVTWTDQLTDETSEIYSKVDRIITYDAEEEDPGYHQRMVDSYEKRNRI